MVNSDPYGTTATERSYLKNILKRNRKVTSCFITVFCATYVVSSPKLILKTINVTFSYSEKQKMVAILDHLEQKLFMQPKQGPNYRGSKPLA